MCVALPAAPARATVISYDQWLSWTEDDQTAYVNGFGNGLTFAANFLGRPHRCPYAYTVGEVMAAMTSNAARARFKNTDDVDMVIVAMTTERGRTFAPGGTR